MTEPRVKFVRNFDQVRGDMKPGDLMVDTLSNDFLYSTVHVGELAAQFFTDSMVGADFDRRLRQRFAEGFEKLLTASPTDVEAISAAQQECHVVLGIYDTLATQLEDKSSALEELKLSATEYDLDLPE